MHLFCHHHYHDNFTDQWFSFVAWNSSAIHMWTVIPCCWEKKSKKFILACCKVRRVHKSWLVIKNWHSVEITRGLCFSFSHLSQYKNRITCTLRDFFYIITTQILSRLAFSNMCYAFCPVLILYEMGIMFVMKWKHNVYLGTPRGFFHVRTPERWWLNENVKIYKDGDWKNCWG